MNYEKDRRWSTMNELRGRGEGQLIFFKPGIRIRREEI